MKKRVIVTHFTMKIIRTSLYITCNKKILLKIPQPIVGIHRLLCSACCSLNTNPAITRQLIRTARTLEVEWWQVCVEAWVRGQRKMSQARVCAAGFQCYGPFSLGARFETYEPFLYLIFQIFSGCGKPRMTETADTGIRARAHAHTHTHTYARTHTRRHFLV